MNSLSWLITTKTYTNHMNNYYDPAPDIGGVYPYKASARFILRQNRLATKHKITQLGKST